MVTSTQRPVRVSASWIVERSGSSLTCERKLRARRAPGERLLGDWNLTLLRRHPSIEGYGIRPAGDSEGEWRLDRLNSVVGLPPGVSDREAMLLLDALARLKEHRFGRLTVMVSDGRVVDVEVSEKIDHDLLRRLSM